MTIASHAVLAALLVLASASAAFAECTTAADARAVLAAARKAVRCNQKKLTAGPGASCPDATPPPCSESLVGDTVALAYGPNNPPGAAVDGAALRTQLRCQRTIGRGAAIFVGRKLRYLLQGLTEAEAEARARMVIDRIPNDCAVTVLQDGGVLLPAVGKQADAAVGPQGDVVDAVALRDALVTLLGVWVDRVRPNAPALRPNIVVILTDDQRADTASLTVMPRLHAALAASGVSLPNGFVSNPVCCPSRSTILTGQYANNHGVLSNNPGSDPLNPTGGIQAFADGSTLATWLHDLAGYRTALFGKYLNGYHQFTDAYFAANGVHYVPPGWDRWRGISGGKFHWMKLITEAGVEIGTDPGTCIRDTNTTCPTTQAPDCPYSTDYLRDRALEFIDESVQLGEQFFLYLAVKAPHGPACPAVRHVGTFSGVAPHRPPNYLEGEPGWDPDDDKPAWLQQQGPHDGAATDAFRIKQLESLQAVDEAVETIMQKLRDTGIERDTIVVFYGDNGFLWGEHRRGKKSCPYEECLRVPSFVHYPRLAPLPRSDAGLVVNIDLAPTFAELAGITAVPLQMDGRSMIRLLDGTEPAWRGDFLAEHWGNQAPPSDTTPAIPTFAVVRGTDWKYTEYCTGERELYDLTTDPFELDNVVAENPGIATTMAGRLQALRPGWPDALPFPCGTFPDEDEEED